VNQDVVGIDVGISLLSMENLLTGMSGTGSCAIIYTECDGAGGISAFDSGIGMKNARSGLGRLTRLRKKPGRSPRPDARGSITARAWAGGRSSPSPLPPPQRTIPPSDSSPKRPLRAGISSVSRTSPVADRLAQIALVTFPGAVQSSPSIQVTP